MLARTVLALTLFCVASSHAFADWLAVAQSRSPATPTFFFLKDTDRNSAMQGSLRLCKRSDCRIVFLEERGCFVVAAKRDMRASGDFFWATSDHWQDATARALQACLRTWGADNCSVTEQACAGKEGFIRTAQSASQQVQTQFPKVPFLPSSPQSIVGPSPPSEAVPVVAHDMSTSVPVVSHDTGVSGSPASSFSDVLRVDLLKTAPYFAALLAAIALIFFVWKHFPELNKRLAAFSVNIPVITWRRLGEAAGSQPVQVTAEMREHAARELRVAMNYIDSLDDLPSDWGQAQAKIHHVLYATTKHLARARKWDPECEIELPPKGKDEKVRRIRLDTATARALYFEGYALHKARFRKERKRAVDALRKCIAISETHADYHLELAYALQRLGKDKEAQIHIERALQLEPESMKAHKMADGMVEGTPPEVEDARIRRIYEPSAARKGVAGLAVIFLGYGIVMFINGNIGDGVGAIVIAFACGLTLRLLEKFGR